MAKLKYISKQGQASVKMKLSPGETINGYEASFFSQNAVRGFIRPAPDGANKLVFSGANGIALSDFLRRNINKDQFFIIAAQIIEAYKIVTANKLFPAKILLKPEYITINENTGELSLIYQPLNSPELLNKGLSDCFAKIAVLSRFVSPQDGAVINNFMGFISNPANSSVNNIENYIASVSPLTYTVVPRMNYPADDQAAPAPVNIPEQRESAPQMQNSLDDIQKKSFAKNYETSYADDEVPPVNNIIPEQSQVLPENPPVLQEAPLPKLKKADFFEQPEKPSAEAAPAIERTSAPAYAPDNTVQDAQPEAVPKLTRRSTNETAVINKNVFVIGKERAKVDFCVTENKTVSRCHATIYRRSDGCYVSDNNSTNRTFINGSPIPVRTEIKLNNGDVLRLSNEEFDYIEA